MGWSSDLGDRVAGTGGFQSPPKNDLPAVSHLAPKDPAIVFFTSDDKTRFFCHKVSDHPHLRQQVIRVAHNATKDDAAQLVENTSVVVIATCRASLDKDSPAQTREKLLIELARSHKVPIVILAGENHEACQDHLAVVRGAYPLVIVPVHNGHFGEGFMECFPPRTQFVERGDTDAHVEQIARELLKRLP